MKIHIPAFEPILKANEHLAHGAFDIDLGEDVVKVVRCKDCKWFAPNNDGHWLGCSMMYDIKYCPEDAPTENDYCSFAERKSE